LRVTFPELLSSLRPGPRKSTGWPSRPHTSRQTAPTVGLPDPDAALDVFYVAVACLHTWMTWLLAEGERVNGPVSAQLLADELEARLGGLGRAGAAGLAAGWDGRTIVGGFLVQPGTPHDR